MSTWKHIKYDKVADKAQKRGGAIIGRPFILLFERVHGTLMRMSPGFY